MTNDTEIRLAGIRDALAASLTDIHERMDDFCARQASDQSPKTPLKLTVDRALEPVSQVVQNAEVVSHLADAMDRFGPLGNLVGSVAQTIANESIGYFKSQLELEEETHASEEIGCSEREKSIADGWDELKGVRNEGGELYDGICRLLARAERGEEIDTVELQRLETAATEFSNKVEHLCFGTPLRDRDEGHGQEDHESPPSESEDFGLLSNSTDKPSRTPLEGSPDVGETGAEDLAAELAGKLEELGYPPEGVCQMVEDWETRSTRPEAFLGLAGMDIEEQRLRPMQDDWVSAGDDAQEAEFDETAAGFVAAEADESDQGTEAGVGWQLDETREEIVNELTESGVSLDEAFRLVQDNDELVEDYVAGRMNLEDVAAVITEDASQEGLEEYALYGEPAAPGQDADLTEPPHETWDGIGALYPEEEGAAGREAAVNWDDLGFDDDHDRGFGEFVGTGVSDSNDAYPEAFEYEEPVETEPLTEPWDQFDNWNQWEQFDDSHPWDQFDNAAQWNDWNDWNQWNDWNDWNQWNDWNDWNDWNNWDNWSDWSNYSDW